MASTLAGEFAFSISLVLALLFLGVVIARARHRRPPGARRGAARRSRAVPPDPGDLRHHRRRGGRALLDRRWPRPGRSALGWHRRLDRRGIGVVDRGRAATAAPALDCVTADEPCGGPGSRWSPWSAPADRPSGPCPSSSGALPERHGVGEARHLLAEACSRDGSATASRPSAATAGAGIPGDLTWVDRARPRRRRSRRSPSGAALGHLPRRARRRARPSAFVLAPQGRLWNARLLPFWYLCLYLLAALAVAEIVDRHRRARRPGPERPHRRGRRWSAPSLVALVAVVVVALPLAALPFGSRPADGDRYTWLGLQHHRPQLHPRLGAVELLGLRAQGAYPEYRELIDTMTTSAATAAAGGRCGSTSTKLDRYGTPMALMLLPYWTDGCIGSMEGLYFEASATTPYHFLNQSELSQAPSRAAARPAVRRPRHRPRRAAPAAAGRALLPGVLTTAPSPRPTPNPDSASIARPARGTSTRWPTRQLVVPLDDEPAVVEGVAKGGTRPGTDMARGLVPRPGPAGTCSSAGRRPRASGSGSSRPTTPGATSTSARRRGHATSTTGTRPHLLRRRPSPARRCS